MKNQWKISSSFLKGSMKIPASKSQSMRAILFALLANGKSQIKNFLKSPDVYAMLTACHHLGAFIEEEENCLNIKGVGGKICGAEDVIQSGNSGLVLRLIGSVSALGSRPIVITGDHSIRHLRPVVPLLEALSQLGVEAISTRDDGRAPIIIRGPMRSGSATLNGEDSQPVSGLLIASAFAAGAIEIFVTNPGEKPWVNLTLDWLDRVGISYIQKNFSYYKLEGKASIAGFEYHVPADFSSLSYPLAAAILTGSELQIDNLDFSDLQGDKKVISYFQKMGASIEIEETKKKLIVKKNAKLFGISIDINDCIDALPLLAVVGCFAEGKTEIAGAAIARQKESDRISCIVQELKKMGALIEETPDGLIVYRSSLKGAEVNSCSDHRIALSLAIAALATSGETIIHGTACAEKSFPNFCEHMKQVGACITHT